MNDGEFSVQGYLDYQKQDTPLFIQDQFVADLDAQLHKQIGERNEIVVGAGVRFYSDELSNTFRYTFLPDNEKRWLLSTFIQNEYTAVPDKLHITIGAKVEHTEYAGFEFQPNLRILYLMAENQTLWASVARAARTPSRAERTGRIVVDVIPPNPFVPVPIEVTFQSVDNFKTEDLVAFEAGYRISLSEAISFDSALFYNKYSNLRSVEPGGISSELTPVPHAVVTNYAENGIRGSTYGAELTANYQPVPIIRLQGTMSLLQYDLEQAPDSLDSTSVESIVGTSPESQFSLRAMIDVTKGWNLDILTHYTSPPYISGDRCLHRTRYQAGVDAASGT